MNLVVKGVEKCYVRLCTDENLFKDGFVSHVCWSSHLREEYVVMLKNGDLFFFDKDSYGKKFFLEL